MLQFNLLTLTLLAILFIYKFQTTECWRYPSFGFGSQAFTKKKDFKLSQTYNDISAIVIQCTSYGQSIGSENAFYADVHFTFKQADGTTSGNLRHVYTSQHISSGTWKADDKKGIQLSSISMESFWNPVYCDVVNVTTDSKSAQRSITIAEYEIANLQCPEDNSALTINEAIYGTNQEPNCTSDVRDIVTELCNSMNNSKTCTFSVSNGQLGGDPCFRRLKHININYTCTRSNCEMNIGDGIDSNCSSVWTESLTKPVSKSPTNVSTVQPPQQNLDITKYETKLAQLQEDQRQIAIKVQTHEKMLKENDNLIQEWIIPTLGFICSETNSPTNQEHCIKQIERLLERSEKSFEMYKKLHTPQHK